MFTYQRSVAHPVDDAPLTFPDEVVAVFAVKPPDGAQWDPSLVDAGRDSGYEVPLEHVGDGSYRVSSEPEARRGLAEWIAAHGDQMDSGLVVLERLDGLYRQLRELNPSAASAVSVHLSVVGQRLDSGLACVACLSKCFGPREGAWLCGRAASGCMYTDDTGWHVATPTEANLVLGAFGPQSQGRYSRRGLVCATHWGDAEQTP